MKTRLSDWNKFWIALGAGLLGLCIAIEIVRAIYNQGWQKSFFSTVAYIGQLTWLSEFQTLLTGAAAVMAATLSVRAIRDQIKSSEVSNANQIKHSEELEASRIEAKRAAARAVLPMALSTLSEYSTETSEKLVELLHQCSNGMLPKTTRLPSFVEFPEEVVSSIKEMIEYTTPENRNYFWQTLLKVQVLRARLKGLIDSHSKSYSIVSKSNIQAYLLDSVEISARAAALFDFGRGAKEHPPEFLTRDQMQAGVRSVIIDDDDLSDIIERYDLKGGRKWGERWLRG